MHIATWLSTGHPTRDQRDFVAAAIDQVQTDVRQHGHRSRGSEATGNGSAASGGGGVRGVSGGGDQQWRVLVDHLEVLERCAQTLADGNLQQYPGESPANNDVSITGRAHRANSVSDQLAALIFPVSTF